MIECLCPTWFLSSAERNSIDSISDIILLSEGHCGTMRESEALFGPHQRIGRAMNALEEKPYEEFWGKTLHKSLDGQLQSSEARIPIDQ